MTTRHIPVLLKEAIAGLDLQNKKIIVDGTAGFGGHTQEMVANIKAGAMILALDRDEEACDYLRKQLTCGKTRVIVRRGNFAELHEYLDDEGLGKAEAVLLDLGVSSWQLERIERGFGFESERLDMRLHQTEALRKKLSGEMTLTKIRRLLKDDLTAWHLVNFLPEAELREIIRNYGEDKFAKMIANKICRARKEKIIESGKELVKIVGGPRIGKGLHPATRTFQALRIAVNDELGSLEHFLENIGRSMASGGRVVIISFHSLEDRIVKNFINKESVDCVCPPEIPVCRCGHRARVKKITKKPLVPTEQEVVINPRSRSAKIRIFEII